MEATDNYVLLTPRV